MYIYIYIFTSKCHSQTTHPWSGDNQGRKTFLALSADDQTHNYDTEWNHIYKCTIFYM